MSDKELLPCPGCGSEAEESLISEVGAKSIFCTNCPINVEDCVLSMDELRIIWNNMPRDFINCSDNYKEYN